MLRTSCIIATGVWDGDRILFKNRDRAYTPKVRIVHDVVDGVEVLYMEDDTTGWIEGLNEFGLGMVNAALIVGHDELEHKIVKKGPKRTQDGDRAIRALVKRTPDEAAKAIRSDSRGLLGHTLIATKDDAISIEMVDKRSPVEKTLGDGIIVRTNHGIRLPDAGYTHGEDYLSSVARRDQAISTLEDIEDSMDIAPAVYGLRKKDRKSPNNMVRDTDKMRTTSQIVMNLNKRLLVLYLIPGKVEYLGYENRLPKGRKPKCKFEVLEYTDLDGDGDFDILDRKKKASEAIPGGKARDRRPSDFDRGQIERGIEVEQEHLEGGGYTKRERDDLAREIAMDHLTEIPDYYTRLNRMEEQAKKAMQPFERVAAKYKDKKKVPSQDGGETTVYVYSDRQVANRHREKAERIDKLRTGLTDLRKKVKSDIKSDDPKTRLTALAVALIDATYERVGNDESADNGHFGVTGWLKEHVSIKGKKVTISYVGKSGVKHEKEVTDAWLVSALKDCCDDKAPEDALLSFGKDDKEGPVKITSKDVNEYLKPFDITAKDLRGYHANREMQERLREIRKAGPTLPHGRKEKDEILKKEFKKALEQTAERVGHEPATLRKQYLVPWLEEEYMHDGTVIDKLEKTAHQRVAARYKCVPEGMRLFDYVRGYKQISHIRRIPIAKTTHDIVLGLENIQEQGLLIRGKPYMPTDTMYDLFSDEVVIEEKVDGHPMVALYEGYTFFCESLKVRHSVDYDACPYSAAGWPDMLVVYDVLDGEYEPPYSPGQGKGKWLTRSEKESVCHMVGAPVVPLVFRGKVRPEDVPKLADRLSSFGSSPSEGVVIKNLKRGIFGKFVNIEFQKRLTDEDTWGGVHPEQAGILNQRRHAMVSRIASRWMRLATLSESEQEDRQAERLVRPAPENKPPRRDLRRQRVETTEDRIDKRDRE